MKTNSASSFVHSLVRRFQRETSGSVVVMFALAFPALLGATGIAVDYAAVSQSRAKLQAATDSAALSLAREMTVGPMTNARVQQAAGLIVNANLDPDNLATVTGALIENGMAISIKVSQRLKTPLGLMAKLGGVDTLEATAIARVTASSLQTKLCILSLGTAHKGGIFLHNGAMITAPECVLQSNSADKDAVIVQNGSKVTANLFCARGGVANSAGQLQAQILVDCPAIVDPLAKKLEPSTQGSCLASDMRIGEEKQVKQTTQSGGKGIAKRPGDGFPSPIVERTLSPGIYCNGLTIGGNARVTLNPGVYIIRDGAFIVRGNAELIGRGVTFLMVGSGAYFRFLDNSLIQISAPTSGVSAGMLLWESKRFVAMPNSWQQSNCNLDDDDDESQGGAINPATGQPYRINGARTCTGNIADRRPGQVPTKKINEHHINSDRARELTGTIYLPNGLLLVDSRRPVAEQSPFTVLVANKVDLFDGPNLILNANYNSTTVPVPAGLGAIGATQVRLGGAATPGAPPPPPARDPAR